MYSSRPVNREKAEAELALHIKKATNPEETAPKQKHVRACIVYTWDNRSSASVWQGFRSTPMLGDEVQTFKALISVHKIIRDGHPITLKEALRERDWLDQCARSTSAYDGRGYSILIREYVSFLMAKLRYHEFHPEFNGTFDYKEYTTLKGIDDPNEGYETISDLMNLQDQIDQLQKLIFANFRPSSNNECRIAALVPLVEESYAIYKFATSMLRAMYRRTGDPEGLDVLRQRYNGQHYALIKFYYECSNLRYLTSLISVPKLPQDPPNLVGGDSPPALPARQAVAPETPPASSPDPNSDWANQQREIARKQREYELEQSRLQQQREMEQQEQQMRALKLQQEFEEQQRLLMERERQQREQLEREQAQRQAQGRVAELERDVLAFRGQYERDQMLLNQKDQRIQGLEAEMAMLNLNAQQQLASKDEMMRSIQEQINMWKSKYEALAKLYSQLRQEHLDLLGKFKSAQLKANSAQEAIDKMEKMQKEIKDKNLEMADMIRERDRAKNELLRWQNTQSDEIARLKRDLEMANGRVEDLSRSKSSEVGAMVAKFNREKQDLEDLANRRQREIDDLLRRIDDQQADIERMKVENETLEAAMDESLIELEALKENQNMQSSDLQERMTTMTASHKKKLQQILDSILVTCITKVEEAVNDLDSPAHFGNQNATPEFTLSMIEKSHTASTELELALLQYLRTSGEGNQVEVIHAALSLAQIIVDVLENAKGITRLAKKDEDAEEIIRQGKAAGFAGQEFFTNSKSDHIGGLSAEGSIRSISRSNEGVQSAMERLAKAAESLISKNTQLDPSKMDLGDMVEHEMDNAARTIEQATMRLQALISKPKNENLSAIELAVHASILESAMAMMQAIGHLIKCATISQQEIVAQGRGTSTNAAFYKKNHRWTEGLISAAKAVAMATQMLVETADGVISGTHSMEQMLVASNEVAAATAQLVAASRVKATFMSKAQDNLERASKAVTEASKALVRAVKAIMERELKERESKVDYQSMAAHEFKVREMEQQVEILKLEKELTLARRVLAEMRKVSYHQGDD
ncbi:sla2 Src-like adaptor 2 [Actinomortierella wolfii]|nr:sla2 Src-like adaptor 2 [Actinomortierella wolfii]